MRGLRFAMVSASLIACGGGSADTRIAQTPPSETRHDCSDASLWDTIARSSFDEHEAALGLPDPSVPEACDSECLRAAEARLGLARGLLEECGDEVDPCRPSWLVRVVHVQPAEAGRCAFAVERAELAYETPIGIEIPLATRHVSVEVDPDRPGQLRTREAELTPEHSDFRIGRVVGDLDGDGLADWLHVRTEQQEICLGATFDTPECQGYGLPASRVLDVRGERGLLAEALPVSGAVITEELDRAMDRIDAAREECDSQDIVDGECEEPELGVTWRGRRPRGAPVARRVQGGFAIDQVVEEVDCEELCVTPLGDVCTETPSEEYQLSSERCRSLGIVVESHVVRGGEVERSTRPAPDGTVASLACGDGCSIEAVAHRFGDGDPTPHRIAFEWPESPWPVWRSEGATLALPTGVFVLRLVRATEGASETWLVTITAETGELAL